VTLEDIIEKNKPEHPAAYSRAYDYDMFNYTMHEDRLKKFLDRTREHRDEYRQIRDEQAKLGDKLYEPDGYDEWADRLIKSAKEQKTLKR
jgi:hypothetical protein